MKHRFEKRWKTTTTKKKKRSRRRRRFFEEEDHQRKKETHRDGQSFLFSLSSNVARLEFDRRFVQRVSANRARIERRRPRPDGNRVPFFHLDLSLWLILLSRRRGGVHGSGVVVVHGDERRDSLYVENVASQNNRRERERSNTYDTLGFHNFFFFFLKKKKKEEKNRRKNTGEEG